jgi:hypothetical protein
MILALTSCSAVLALCAALGSAAAAETATIKPPQLEAFESIACPCRDAAFAEKRRSP